MKKEGDFMREVIRWKREKKMIVNRKRTARRRKVTSD
jgi:hypothetical protein